MARDLTDVNTYPPAITVPEGSDSRSNAAEDVELAAQGLANRTEWLRAFVVRAILSDDAARSIFTVPIQGNTLSPRDPVLWSDTGPHDDPGKPTNPWKEFLRGRNQAGTDAQRSGLYIGDGTQGLIGLVVNAMWRDDHGASPGRWEQLDATKPSYFLFVNASGDLRFSKKDAATANWTAWDTTTACAIVAPGVMADNVQVNALLYAQAIVAVDDLGWVAARSHTTPIRLGQAMGNYVFKPLTMGYRFQEDTDLFDMYFPINVPVGATITAVRVRHVQATSSGDRMSLCKRTNHTSGAITITEQSFQTANSSITGSPTDKITTITVGGGGYDVAAGEEMLLRWRINDTGSPTAITNNELRAADLDWAESVVSYQ